MSQGWPVLRLNLRGAAPEMKFTSKSDEIFELTNKHLCGSFFSSLPKKREEITLLPSPLLVASPSL